MKEWLARTRRPVVLNVRALVRDVVKNTTRDWTLRQIQAVCPSALSLDQVNDAVWMLCQRGQLLRVNGKQGEDGRGWSAVERIYRWAKGAEDDAVTPAR